MKREWQAPGGGRWEQDAEHMPRPISRYLFETVHAMFDGMADGMRDYGIPLAGFDVRLVGGRIYGRVRPVGAPDPDGRFGASDGTPPTILMRTLFRFHPELRRRTKAAQAALDSALWRREGARWWTEQEPALRQRNLGLARIDVTALDDAALAGHIERIHVALAEGYRIHGRLAPVYGVPLGRWLRRAADWSGQNPGALLDVLRGDSPASAAAVASIDAIADAVRATRGADRIVTGSGSPDDRLARLGAASPDITTAIDAYLVEDGYRLATGFDIVDTTARELPGLLVDSIAARLDGQRSRPVAANTSVAQVRDHVPDQHRKEYDLLLADARAVYGVRDSNVWITAQWPQGILRHALLEAARRLVGRGAIVELDNVFDSAPGEVAALLHGATQPSAAELDSRTRERVAWAAETPPLAFGGGGVPPPMDAMPAAVAELTGAMMFLFEADTARPARAAPDATNADNGHVVAVEGLGVSAGTYRGRARVVIGPPDFARIQAGDILVATSTSPAYNILLPLIGAVVTDRGGLLSHAALVAREFGIPAVVGTTDATSRIQDGATVTVDAERGVVLIQ